MARGNSRLVVLLAISAAVMAPEAAAQQARRDRHGDSLPPGAVARLGTVRLQQGGKVQAVAFAPDGKQVASAGWCAGGIRLWEAATGREAGCIADEWDEIGSLAYSPDGKLLAAGHSNGYFSLWDTATGKNVRRLSLWHGNVVAGIGDVCFSSDGRIVACADALGFIRCWDVARPGKLPAFEGPRRVTTILAFCPRDPLLLASGDKDGVSLWSLETYKEVRRFRMPGGVGHCLAFSPDGEILATGGADQAIRLWDAATGKEQRRLDADKLTPLCLAFSPDGRLLLAGGTRFLLWEVASGKKLRQWGEGEGWAHQLAFAPDGKTVASAHHDSRVRLWETASGKPLHAHEGHQAGVAAIAFSPDGRALASAGKDGDVRVWDVAGQQRQQRIKNIGTMMALAYSPNGKLLASGSWYSGDIQLWDPATGKESRRFERGIIFHPMRFVPRGCSSLTFSPDGKTLVSGHTADYAVCLWHMTKTKGPRILRGHEARVLGVAIAPDGRSLASGSSDQTIRLWETATGKERICLKGHTEEVDALAFSPDGRHIASVSHDFTVRLWDVYTGENVCLGDKVRGAPGCLAFSPDGGTLAVSRYGPEIQLWDVASAAVRGKLTGHRGQVHALAFSPDGQLLASAGEDGTVLLWAVSPPKRGRTPRQEAGRKGDAPSAKELERLFAELASADAARAYRALGAVVAARDAAVSFLDSRLHPLPHLDPKYMGGLIADLDDDRFSTREQAARALADLNEMAGPALRRALADGPTLEVRRRIEGLLQRLDREVLSAETLRVLRCLEALEAIGTPRAIEVLRRMARGEPAARLTQEARASLARLQRKNTLPTHP